MKKLILLCFLFAPVLLKAQVINLPVDSSTQKVTYADVVQAPGLSKDELYLRGREWFAKTFVSAQAVIQMDDKASGKIIGKGTASGSNTSFLVVNRYTIFYTVSLTVKDGRYRYEVTDFYFQNEPSQYVHNPPKTPIDEYATNPKYRKKDGSYKYNMTSVVQSINANALDLIEGLKKSLQASATGIKAKDDF